MTSKDIAEIAYKNGYNNAIRAALQAQRNVQLFLTVLVCISLIMSIVLTIKVNELTRTTETELTEVKAEVNTITKEFRNLAARIEKLENS